MAKLILVIIGLVLIYSCPAILLTAVGAGGAFIATRIALARQGGREEDKNRPQEKTRGFKTYQEVQQENVERILKKGYDPWSPENRERTQAIHDHLDRARAAAQKEMEEEIEQEKRNPPDKRTVQQILSEPVTK